MDGDARWTWREAVHEGATRGALALSLFGYVKPHIGVLLPNGAEYLFWLNGAALAGAAIVGINPTRRGEALAADVRATDCAVIITDDEGAALLRGLDLGVHDDKVLVVGTERYEALLQQFAGGDEAQVSLRMRTASTSRRSTSSSSRRGRPACPKRCAARRVGWPVSPRWRDQASATGPTTSATAPCRCSTATH